MYAANGSIDNAGAISLSLFIIVMTSVVLGTGLPFLLTKVRGMQSCLFVSVVTSCFCGD